MSLSPTEPDVTAMDDEDLDALEKKMYRSFSEDGLLEIVVGLLLLVSGLGLALDAAGVADAVRILVTVPLMFLGIPLVYWGKKNIVTPRLGVARFSERRRDDRRKVIGALTASLVVMNGITFAVLYGGLGGDAYGGFGPLLAEALVVSVILMIFGIISYMMEYPRLFAAGVLFAGAEVTYYFASGASGGPLVPLAVYVPFGLAVIIMGALALRGFRARYPLPDGPARTNGAPGV